MLKYSFLVFVVAVAISWPSVEARPGKHISLKKRDTELSDEINELSEESQDKLAKQFLAGLLLLTVDSDNSAEVDRLTLEFKKAVDKKWDSIDDFATHLAKVYEDVTGRKLDASQELE